MTKLNLPLNSEEQAIQRYAGLLTQDEFRLRYCFIKARINIGYTPEELSFLIGRPGFYIPDYEQLNNGIKLTLEDLEILSLILTNLYPEVLPLDIDDFGTNEKRLVRGKREEIYGHYHYSFKHFWTIDGKSFEIHLKESVCKLNETAAVSIAEEVVRGVHVLLGTDFFMKKQRSALEIFIAIKPLSKKYLPFVKPCHLMPVIYKLVKERVLVIVNKRNRVYYWAGSAARTK